MRSARVVERDDMTAVADISSAGATSELHVRGERRFPTSPALGRRRPLVHRRLTSLIVTSLALAACAGPSDGVAGPGVVQIARPGSSNSAVALLGTWRRAEFFVDDLGFTRSAETTWIFSPDRSATRTTVTRNIDLGLTDVQLTAGTWRLSDTNVIIDVISPAPVRFEFTVRVVGNQLELAGQSYLRVIE
ncbi:MAG: hypothetical protein ABIT38_05190 [Gemmatimonadaceae bacterium]